MAKNGILVTGGSGLVGAYAVGMLLERGERPVVFDVAVNERLLGAAGVDTTKVALIRGDMMDLPALISALRDMIATGSFIWRPSSAKKCSAGPTAA